jgi:type IV secretory pathway VirB2 component (pilin)
MGNTALVSRFEQVDTAQTEPRAARCALPAIKIALLRLGVPLLFNVVAVPAFAAGGNTDPATILQAVLKVMTGSMGTALAALGIIACGLAWMFGRASLGLISGVVGGIMIVFSSAYVANQLVGTGG